MTTWFIDKMMQHWHAGRDTYAIAIIMHSNEAQVAKALRIGRKAELKRKGAA